MRIFDHRNLGDVGYGDHWLTLRQFARYYHPGLRRFLNQDTVLGSIGASASMNRFAYANGNPISAIDPFGTMAQDAPQMVVSVAVGTSFTIGEIAATNSGDYASASKNKHQHKASRSSGLAGVHLTIRTLQRKVPPLHPLSLGSPVSIVHIQGTTFTTNRVSNATCLAMLEQRKSLIQEFAI